MTPLERGNKSDDDPPSVRNVIILANGLMGGVASAYLATGSLAFTAAACVIAVSVVWIFLRYQNRQ